MAEAAILIFGKKNIYLELVERFDDLYVFPRNDVPLGLSLTLLSI